MTSGHTSILTKVYIFQCVLFVVYGLQSYQCCVDLLQLSIDVQDVATVILEGTATVMYTVFENELGPPPLELGIVIEPPRNVSFKAPDSLPITPSSSIPPVPTTSSSASTGTSLDPNELPTLIANVNTLLLEFTYSPDGQECSINPDSRLHIRLLFETLTKALNERISTLQYYQFSSAIIEIAEEYIKTCKASTSTIYTLYDQFIEVRQSNASSKPNQLRRIFAKALCSHIRNKRQSVTAPTMSDFFREITDFDARDMFGFNMNSWGKFEPFPTLSFVVGTSGSMSHAIAGVREAIKSIIVLEQQNPFFLIFTPFNDYDGDSGYSHMPNYGPNTIATTRFDAGDSYQELKNLYSVVSNLTAHSGGDEPEYCMGGILETLRASRTVSGVNLNFYSAASQIIVITDATAKDVYLLENVTTIVSGTGVKVHFILASESVRSYSPYQRIANISKGIVLTSTFDIGQVIQTLATFASKLTSNIMPIINATLLTGKKRSANTCNSIGVSLFTSLINVFYLQTISLAYPNGTTTQMPGPNTFSVKSPDAGQWTVCSTGAMYYGTETDVQYAVTFLDSKFSTPDNLPSVCTKGMVVVNIFDDKAKFISPDAWLGLELLNPDNAVLTTVSLINCSGTYLGNITYPEGIVTSLRLSGRDYLGYDFRYQRKTSSPLSFSANSCRSLRLVSSQSSGVVVASGESRIFSFSLLVTASTTPVEITISAASHSDRISRLVLTNGSVISSEAIATIRVNVSASTSTNGTATVSFTVQAHCGCNVNDAYEQVFQISSGASTPTDQCGGCLNGGTCVYLFGRYFCSCPSSYIGTYCQTMN